MLVLYDDAGAGDDVVGGGARRGRRPPASAAPTPVDARVDAARSCSTTGPRATLLDAGMAAIAGLRSGMRAVRRWSPRRPTRARIAAMARAAPRRRLALARGARGEGDPARRRHPRARRHRHATTRSPPGGELGGPVAIKRLGLRHKARERRREARASTTRRGSAARSPARRCSSSGWRRPGRSCSSRSAATASCPCSSSASAASTPSSSTAPTIQPLPRDARTAGPIAEHRGARSRELPFALIELNPVIVHRDGAIAVDALALEEDT